MDIWLTVCMSVYLPHVRMVPVGAREDISGRCEPWKLNEGLLEEQPLSAEPSLQPDCFSEAGSLLDSG